MPIVADVDCTWLNPGGTFYDAGELRLADAAGFVAPGITRTLETPDALAVSVDGSDNVTVQPGSVVVSGEDAVSGTGFYRYGLGAAQSQQLDARDATNDRRDRVVARVLDTDVVGTHPAYTGRVEILTGTPSATPSAPPTPDMAVSLAVVDVPVSGGGAASVDASHREYACAPGGVLQVPTQAELPSSAPAGQHALALDTAEPYEWDGSSWLASRARIILTYTGANVRVTPGNTAVVNWSSASEAVGATESSGIVSLTPGLYQLDASVGVTDLDNGRVQAGISVNGNLTVVGLESASTLDTRSTLKASRLVRIASGDQVTVEVSPASGAGNDVEYVGFAAQTYFSAVRLGA